MAAQLSTIGQAGKLFQVAVIGAGASDLEVFKRIFNVTRYRPRTYQLLELDDNSLPSEIELAASADIFVVNLLNTKSVMCWQKLSALIASDKRKPVLKISKVTPSSTAGSEFTIPWPINPAKMLQSLDNYTIRHLHYYPEFEIGSEEEPSTTALKNIKAISLTTHVLQEAPQTKKIRVLVADDSLAVRRQLKIEFDLMDAALHAVADGESAIKAAEKDKYDVIFLDVVMPGVDGYAVCKSIRRTKLNRNTPVVMLTSRSSNIDKLKGVLAGCDTYLTKPINHNEFIAVTEKHIGAEKNSGAQKQINKNMEN